MANGWHIKSLVFTTDLVIIRNCDTDVVFAVYPFTPQSATSHTLINGSYIPVFCDYGGDVTREFRTSSLAQDVEGQGVMDVVLNTPINDLNLFAATKVVDIPVIIAVINEETDIAARLTDGASTLNVVADPSTTALARKIRRGFLEVPIVTSGGSTKENIQVTAAIGANVITFIPPSIAELFRGMMVRYRGS